MMWSVGISEALHVVLLTFSLLLVLAWLLRRPAAQKGRFPPGPMAWPVTGHMHLLAHLPHQALAHLSAKHGPILGLRFGHRRAVVVSTPALAQQFLTTHDKVLAYRPSYTFASTMLYGGGRQIFMTQYGPAWRKLRKVCTLELFTVKRLHELEYVRNEEIHGLLQRIHDQSIGGGIQTVNLGECFGHMSSNLLMRLICSNTCEQSKGGEVLHTLLQEVVQELVPTVGDLIPWLKWLDFARKRHMRNLQVRLDKFLSTILTECQSAMQTVSASGPCQDFASILLSKLHVNDHDGEEGFTMEEIKGVISDMVIAGIHTTALTLEWGMAELLKNPHCLDRLRKEVVSHVRMSGQSKRYVTESDMPKLCYLKCVVKEILRLHPAGPLLVPHVASEELKVGNYILPAQTQAFVNVWAIGRDEQVWHRANQFMPERFQDKNTDVKGQHFELLPFGSGRRMCPGLPLGLSVVEVTLANLAYHFDWELPPGQTCASMDMNEKTGLSLVKATPVIAVPKPRLHSL